MKIATLLILVCLVAAVVARPKARPQDADYEEEPAPRKPVVKTNPILRRGPIARPGQKTTTTTTTQAPLEEEDVADDGEFEEHEQEPVTTTEAPKRLTGGFVRPFRSNDELLATLKRRREQAANGKLHSAKATQDHHDTETAKEEHTPAPKRASSSNGRRNRFSAPTKNTEEHQEAESAPAAQPARSGRRFSSRA